MEPSIVQVRHNHSRDLLSDRAWKTGSIVVGVAAIALSIVTFTLHRTEISSGFLTIAVFVFCGIAGLHARFLHRARAQYHDTNEVLEIRELEFQSVFQNAMDAIVIVDGRKICLEANPSALQLLGASREELIGRSIQAYYSDQPDFDRSWKRLLTRENDRGQSEIVRADGGLVFAEFTATANFLPGWHMIVLRDVTQRRQAEQAREQNLALAKSAWQEADALRTATLALTQDLRMGNVLDTLLETLHRLVPYEAAQVLLLETESKLFLAGEKFSATNAGQIAESPKTLDATDLPVLLGALETEDGILIPDTGLEADWQPISNNSIRSWLGVPLRSSGRIIGLLSVAGAHQGQFTPEHLRVTGSLAIPAAVAIQNARLYERAEIYGSELERRLSDLHRAEQALERSEESRMASEDRFQKVFRSTPIAFSVTSLKEGAFIDVNEAFERRFGFTRKELLGRTSIELGFWEDPTERTRLIDQLRRGARIRGAVSRLRIKSGEFKASFYSAEAIYLDGQGCLLMVSEDMPDCDPKHVN
jgi:PAS domain S-box-containing protein